jgi:hypothetical protein
VYDIWTLLLDYHTYMLSYISEADLEGAWGAGAPPPPLIFAKHMLYNVN